MLKATDQRTPDMRRAAPTPRMQEEMVWVVLSGKPKREAVSMMVAAVVSAAKPWIGSRRVRRLPIVWMMRQPPAAVPSAIAVAARRITSHGMFGTPFSSTGRLKPAEKRARVITPIVFWASLEPWLNAMNAEETSCKRRNRLPTREGGDLAKRKKRSFINRAETMKPITGEKMRGRITLLKRPSQMTLFMPRAAMPAP